MHVTLLSKGAVLEDPHADVALRDALIARLRRDGHLRSSRVEAAFRSVPRHLFVPEVPLEEAYRDQVIVTKWTEGLPVSSSSQPAIMAIMLEQLGLEPGHRILEIGAGTGYNGALMAQLVGEAGTVVAVEIDEDLAASARTHLDAAGFDRVQVVHGDGGQGYTDGAPYDRIILTVGAWDIVPAWCEQLHPTGRLVLPLTLRGVQRTVAFEAEEDHLTSVSVHDCEFMLLRGAWAEPPRRLGLGPDPGLYLTIRDPSSIDAEAVYALVVGPSRDRPTGLRVTSRELFSGLLLWLALREDAGCGLVALGPIAGRGIVPPLCRRSDQLCWATGILEGESLALLTRPADGPPSEGSCDWPPGDHAFELVIRSYGPDDAVARRLRDQVLAWAAAGRPSTDGLRIRAYPDGAVYERRAGEFVIPKRWNRLVLDWPGRHASSLSLQP